MLPATVSRPLSAVGVFVLYLISFFVFGPERFGPGSFYWFSTALALAAFLLAARAAVVAGASGLRTFFGILSASLLLLAVQQALYLQEHPLELPYHVANTLFLYLWDGAWVVLALYVVRTLEPPRTVTRLLAFVLVCLALIYVVYLTQIHPEEGFEFDDYAHLELARRFGMVASLLEAVGLFFGLLVVILGARTGYVLAVLGFSVFAASDFVFLKLEEQRHLSAGVTSDAIVQLQPLWDLGTLFVLLGLLALTRRETDVGGAPTEEAPDRELDRADRPAVGQASASCTALPPVAGDESGRSGLAALLAVLTLGAIFVSASAAVFLEEWPEWLLLLYLLFCVAWLLIIARLTLQFDRAVDFSKAWLDRLIRGRLRPPPRWHGVKGAPWRLVEMTRLGDLLGSVEAGAADLRRDVLFLGPDRIFGSVADRGRDDEVCCFVVMPFSEEWSEEVHRECREACLEAGVRPVRGDDLFKPGSFVEDIWQEIHRADLVIADITGNNANVFYELGIAHTIAKPVLILTQEPEAIPADLKTLRAIPYGGPGSEDWPKRFRSDLAEGIQAVREAYGLAGAG